MAVDTATIINQTRFFLQDATVPYLWADDALLSFLTLSTSEAKAANDPTLGLPILAASYLLDMEATSAAREAAVEGVSIIKTDTRFTPEALRAQAENLRAMAQKMGLIDPSALISITPTFEAFPRRSAIDGSQSEPNLPRVPLPNGQSYADDGTGLRGSGWGF